MPDTVVTYPFDPTGTSPNNVNSGEVHSFSNQDSLRSFMPTHGAFFDESVIIRNVTTGVPLVKDVQYYCAIRMDLLSAICGKLVCRAIVITDPTVGNIVAIDYRAVGGTFSRSSPELLALLALGYIKPRKAAWGVIPRRIENELPNDYAINMAPLVGFEYAVLALNRLASTVRYGDIRSYRALEQYAKINNEEVIATASALVATKVAEHLGLSSPHPSYIRIDALPAMFPVINQPVNALPLADAVGVPCFGALLVGSAYRGLYGVPQEDMQIQISPTNTFVTIRWTGVFGVVTKIDISTVLLPLTKYFWRLRYKNTNGVWSSWSTPTAFTTGAT